MSISVLFFLKMQGKTTFFFDFLNKYGKILVSSYYKIIQILIYRELLEDNLFYI